MVPEEQLEVEELDEILVSEQILTLKDRKVRGKVARRYLVKFKNYSPMDAKWMEEAELVVKTPSKSRGSKDFVIFGHDSVNDAKEKTHVVEQPPVSIGHRKPSTHGLVNGQDSNEQAMIRPSPGLHGFMPDNAYGIMQAGIPNPMYGNIGVQSGFQCVVGSYGMPGANVGMAGFLQPYAQSMNMTDKITFDYVLCSARFVLLGSTARTTGTIQVYELNGSELSKLVESEKPTSIKCGTFGSSSLIDRQLATGDFKGNLHIWDLEKLSLPVFSAKAHDSIINAIDGCGGLGIGYGAPEIVTGGRDGRVCVWDQRQKDDPVVAFEPESRETARDCWTVAFGNSFNDEERCVLAGYDNGDIKLFDLKTCKVRWETSTKNGVCGIQFDRKDIKMNKCVATTLESKFHVFDLRTQHPEKGFACLTEKMSHGSTIWGVKHLPQNREIFSVLGGDGSLSLYKYNYPEQRSLKDMEGKSYGVVGKVNLLSSAILSTQPINCLDWSPDKEGLAVMGSFDQCVRVVIVTKLHKQ
ncbi:hypothetical protein L7F22_003394 [Adiantum nelumboides]|nr:hypothetical protein [Adiantum nelumboides]